MLVFGQMFVCAEALYIFYNKIVHFLLSMFK